jgi:hypothetical protein
MRQDVDRRVGDKIDVVAAAGKRALEISRIERIEEIQHALPVKIVSHIFPPAGMRPGQKRLTTPEGLREKPGA